MNNGVKYLEINSCTVCSGVLSETSIFSEDLEGKFSVRICTVCGLGLTNPQPSEETLHLLYERDESSVAKLGARDFDPVASGGLFDRLKSRSASRELKARILNETASIRIVDYACGNGRYSNEAVKLITGEVLAVDFHEDRPRHLSNEVSYIKQEDFDAREIDVIILRHVLEHVNDPVDFLHDLSLRLSPTGYIYIEVPNRDSIWSRVLGANWIQWYLPRHLNHFNRASLSRCVLEAGLIGNIENCEMPLAGSQLARIFKRDIYSLPWKMVGVLLHPVQISLERIFRTSGCIYTKVSVLK
jgi:SAM-dependent methyltransferase